MPGFWDVTSALGSAGAAIFAAVQIWLSRRDANRRATLAAFERLDARLQPVWKHDVESLQREIIDCYKGGSKPLSEGARTYLAFLNGLDLLAFEAENGLIDANLAREYARTLLRAPALSLSFLQDFQACCGDEDVYEHLTRFFKKELEARHDQRRALNA